LKLKLTPVNKISVHIVDDHDLFREGLKLILTNLSYISSINESENGSEFLSFLRRGRTANIVFMDLEMPVMDGVEATFEALKLSPELNIIALSMYSDEVYYTKMISAGAKGFILKNSSIKDIEEAIRQVLSGKNYFSPEILAKIVKSVGKKKKEEMPFDDLSEREEEVLFNICRGYSNQEISEILHISKRTVDKHRENLLLKTQSRNTVGLVIYAIKNGIVEI